MDSMDELRSPSRPTNPAASIIIFPLPSTLFVLQLLGTIRCPEKPREAHDLVIAMVAARLTEPTSKLATAKALSPETAASSLGAIMGLGAVDEDELYSALDWLPPRPRPGATARPRPPPHARPP